MNLHMNIVRKKGIGKRRMPRQLRIFPLNTNPLTDLKITLLIWPLLWLFGLEQILPPIFLFWATTKLLIKKPCLRIPIVIIPFAFFLIWQIAPQISLEGSRDWVVFGRSMIAYMSAIFLLLILANDVNSIEEIYGVIYALVGLSAVTTCIALLFALQFLPEQYYALLAGNLLPDFLQTSRFVQESILIREIGWLNASFGSFVYPRVSSIFLFPTGAGIGYVIFLFWQGYLVTVARKARRWLLALLFVLSSLVFLFTASRIAWMAFAVSFTLIYLFRYHLKFRLPMLILPALLAIVVVILLLAFFVDDALLQFINTMFLEVRAGSFRARLILYERTLGLWLERPFLGWGVPRHVAGVNLAPVGTHSELLGVLFRSGLVGFTLYLLVIFSIWLQIWQKIRYALKVRNPIVLKLSMVIAALFLSVNLMYFTYSFYWDFLILLLTWTSVGLIYSKPLTPSVPSNSSVEYT